MFNPWANAVYVDVFQSLLKSVQDRTISPVSDSMHVLREHDYKAMEGEEYKERGPFAIHRQ